MSFENIHNYPDNQTVWHVSLSYVGIKNHIFEQDLILNKNPSFNEIFEAFYSMYKGGESECFLRSCDTIQRAMEIVAMGWDCRPCLGTRFRKEFDMSPDANRVFFQIVPRIVYKV